ncbi:MAG: 4-alpha-glucanotransferase [Verrucomicrobiota bacterium]
MLVPVFALRHEKDLGIGDTEAMRQAIDFCASQKLGVLQVLPINETGDDNSPYNAISSIAIDPVYLTLTPELVPGLQQETLDTMFTESALAELRHGPVKYQKVKQLKLEALSHAYIEFEAVDLETGTDIAYEFQAFVEDNMGWLPGYTLFRTLLNEYSNNALWHEWIPEHQTLAEAEVWLATAPDKEELVRYRQFTAYVQWVAWRQWADVRTYADQKRVRLIGDIPFGISRYSADVWSEHELFDLTWSGGAPPEPFFHGGEFLRRWGQNWGIPLYDWPMHRAQNYAWWRQRITATSLIFHGFRIDHVLGFFRIYSFPWMPQQNDEYTYLSPEEAKLKAGGRVPHFIPRSDDKEEDAALNAAEGESLLRMIQESTGPTAIIAEDLGVVPKYVPSLLEKLGIPGFSIPQFTIDKDTREYVPKDEMPLLSIATWGTHDHPPLVTWYSDLTARWRGPNGHEAWLDLQRLMRFLGENPDEEPPVFLNEKLLEVFLRTLIECRSCWAIFTISDMLGVDWRFNAPGTANDDNWSVRLDRPVAEYLTDPVIGPRFTFLRETILKNERAP